MHKGEDLDYKVLPVMTRHLNILKYFFFWSGTSLDLNCSRFAGTSLTVIQCRRNREGWGGGGMCPPLF